MSPEVKNKIKGIYRRLLELVKKRKILDAISLLDELAHTFIKAKQYSGIVDRVNWMSAQLENGQRAVVKDYLEVYLES